MCKNLLFIQSHQRVTFYALLGSLMRVKNASFWKALGTYLLFNYSEMDVRYLAYSLYLH